MLSLPLPILLMKSVITGTETLKWYAFYQCLQTSYVTCEYLAASKCTCTSFQQDFGDYLESYYSVQTNEGEKISQLIAGYIDIILKKVI